MFVLLYHDHWNMLCTMESGQTEQDIIFMSYTSTNYNVYNKVIKYLITFLDQCKVHNKHERILPLVPRLIK